MGRATHEFELLANEAPMHRLWGCSAGPYLAHVSQTGLEWPMDRPWVMHWSLMGHPRVCSAGPWVVHASLMGRPRVTHGFILLSWVVAHESPMGLQYYVLGRIMLSQ